MPFLTFAKDYQETLRKKGGYHAKNKASEEAVKKFKQLLQHKQEMLERVKQYDGICP